MVEPKTLFCSASKHDRSVGHFGEARENGDFTVGSFLPAMQGGTPRAEMNVEWSETYVDENPIRSIGDWISSWFD